MTAHAGVHDVDPAEYFNNYVITKCLYLVMYF